MKFFSFVTLAVVVSSTSANETEALRHIVTGFEKWHLENSPAYANTYFETKMFSHEVNSYDYEAFGHRRDICQSFLTSLHLLDRSKLDEDDQLTYDILEDTLVTYIDAVGSFTDFGNLNPISFMDSWMFFDVLTFRNPVANDEHSFRSFLTFLSSWRIMGMQMESLMRKSMKLNRTYHASAIERMIPYMDSVIESVNTSKCLEETMEPFIQTLNESTNFEESLRLDLEIDIRTGFQRVVLPGLLRMRDFLINEYMPTCRKTAGVIEWDPDHKYYEACVKWHTSLPLTPEQVHKMGVKEVERIQEEMRIIILRNGGNTSTTIAEFSEQLRSDTDQRAIDAGDLVNKYTDLLSEVIQPSLSKMFHYEDIPDTPLEVVAFPYDGPEAAYEFLNTSGKFYVNVQRANERPLYTMTSTALHEGYPGHHMQIALASKLPIPDFRRIVDYINSFAVPVMFPYHNAYTEGWGLYAESLGHSDYLNITRNDADVFGLLAWEMFRACRLVVDTGLHFYNWTREEAVEYMCNNAGLRKSEVESEVDRYMALPGQALGYKIGEMTIKKLREEAKMALGEKFDIRDFHHVVLSLGPMPLNLLERQVQNWYYRLAL